MSDRPKIKLLPGAERRVTQGHPWIYSNEIVMDAEAKALAPGTIVAAERTHGRALGVGFFNPRSLIAFRMLSREADKRIDENFLRRRLERALGLRERLVGVPFYRLIHAEADGLPGCVIDRFGEVMVIEPNSAGADSIADQLAGLLDGLVSPRAILLRADGPARAQEGLAPLLRAYKGEIGGTIEIIENGAKFLANPGEGQKTGWFFDQRDNRRLMAVLAKGADVLDLYAYLGGFGIQALLAGAKSVLAVDRSKGALELARQAAGLNDVATKFGAETAEVFEFLERAEATHRTFDMVIADPPAFVKAKKDLPQGAKAYRKLARMCAGRVRTGGLLFIASCSHNMPVEEFGQQVARGLHDAGRAARILYSTGAAPDHPVHPMLPESAYLKALVLQID